jgi:hypothetical protein
MINFIQNINSFFYLMIYVFMVYLILIGLNKTSQSNKQYIVILITGMHLFIGLFV